MTGALRERELLMVAQRVSRTGGWVWHLGSDEVWWSEALHRVLGTDPETFVPTPDALFAGASPEDQRRGRAGLRSAFPEGSGELEFAVVMPDGERRWVALRAEVIRDQAGEPLRVEGTAQDLTQRRAAQDALLERQRADAEAAMVRRACYDTVTGLPSMELLVNRASVVLERAGRRGSSTAVLVVDLDRFRDVNDEFGHAVGDEVLVRIGEQLDSLFRSYDTVARPDAPVARFAGDEFVVVCEEIADAETARRLGRRIHDALRSPTEVSVGHLAVTAAVGITVAPGSSVQFDALMLQAESAMRRAKERGRSELEVFRAGTGSEVARDKERALRTAFAENQLSIAYQPKIVLATDQVAGVEALLRWSHPERGDVSPSEFIPVAEDSGLIVPIGQWVLEEACRQSAMWQRRFSDRTPLVTSVNLSARQFGPDLVDAVSAAVDAAGIPAGMLCLEVTESILMDDVETATATLKALADLGVALSIDDFGTGYSSLAYLKQFPLDELKIDKSFVDGLGHDPNDTAIVAAVVAMAHALDLSVVAEGVETADQVERLRTLGCEQAQGYHFARPMPAAAIEALLADEAAATWQAHDSERHGAAAGSYRAERVLVVDDATEVRQLARMSLAAIGFDVAEATDGVTAIAAARAAPPDCILLDLVMPGMSGLEVCRTLRDDPATANCTILMLTAKADAADKVDAFSAGADDYILKPFSPRDLTSRVRSAIRRRTNGATNWRPK